MLSEAKHPSICLKRNAETLRCAQGDSPSTLSIFFRYTTLTEVRHGESLFDYFRALRYAKPFVSKAAFRKADVV